MDTLLTGLNTLISPSFAVVAYRQYFLHIGETIAIVLMFSGFLMSTRSTPVAAPSRILAEPSMQR